jgi:5-methylcytosine-specific restriction protein A
VAVGNHCADPFQIPEEVSLETEFEEGAAIRVRINRYERDREHCIKHHGTTCAACGRSLVDQYGPQVIGLIHVHHILVLIETRPDLPIARGT